MSVAENLVFQLPQRFLRNISTDQNHLQSNVVAILKIETVAHKYQIDCSWNLRDMRVREDQDAFKTIITQRKTMIAHKPQRNYT